MDYFNKAVEYLRIRTRDRYPIGIILGTGLGGLVKYIKQDLYIDYSNIPGCPVSTVESHSGKLILGTLSDKKVVTMQGRFHYYEGYSHHKITYPVYLMKELGIKYLIVSNACGSLNPKIRKSDLMIITSHINFHFNSPLTGLSKYFHSQSSRFYSKKLIELAESVALENEIDICKGVYATVQGPNLETRSEYRMIRKFGADVVGMSTIPEAIIAKKLGIEVLGLSIITDEGFPDILRVAVLEDILKAASKTEPYLTLLTEKLVNKIEI